MAAINMDLRRFGRPNVTSFPHLYPLSVRVFVHWNIYIFIPGIKENPTAPKKADKFKPEEIRNSLYYIF